MIANLTKKQQLVATLPGPSTDGAYTLPVATPDTLGGVKIGPGIDVTADGTISVAPTDTGSGGNVTNPLTANIDGAGSYGLLNIAAIGIGTAALTSPLQVVRLPMYDSDGAAVAGGLTAGAFFTDSSGVLHAKL